MKSNVILIFIVLVCFGCIIYYSYAVFFAPIEITAMQLEAPPHGSFECLGYSRGFAESWDIDMYISDGLVSLKMLLLSRPDHPVINLIAPGDGHYYTWRDRQVRGYVGTAAGNHFGNLDCVRRWNLAPTLFAVPPDIQFRSAAKLELLSLPQ